MENKPKIGIKQVCDMLKDGKTRNEIAEFYGISKADCKRLFQHPDLKGKKTIKKPELGFEIVEDEATMTGTVLDSPGIPEEKGETAEFDLQEHKTKALNAEETGAPTEAPEPASETKEEAPEPTKTWAKPTWED